METASPRQSYKVANKKTMEKLKTLREVVLSSACSTYYNTNDTNRADESKTGETEIQPLTKSQD